MLWSKHCTTAHESARVTYLPFLENHLYPRTVKTTIVVTVNLCIWGFKVVYAFWCMKRLLRWSWSCIFFWSQHPEFHPMWCVSETNASWRTRTSSRHDDHQGCLTKIIARARQSPGINVRWSHSDVRSTYTLHVLTPRSDVSANSSYSLHATPILRSYLVETVYLPTYHIVFLPRFICAQCPFLYKFRVFVFLI